MVPLLYLVRHGEADAARQTPSAGPALSDLGRRQAEALGRWFAARGTVFVRMFSSDLARALETAVILAPHCGKPEGEVLPELREVPRAPLPPDDAARIAHAAAAVRSAFDRADGDVCVVAHNGAIRSLLLCWAGMSLEAAGTPRLMLDNTGLTVLDFVEGQPVVLGVNLTYHFPPEAVLRQRPDRNPPPRTHPLGA